MPIQFCSEAYFFRLEVLQRAWNLRLGTPSLKYLPEDLCSVFLRPQKIHRPQAGLNPRGEHVTQRPPRPTYFMMLFKSCRTSIYQTVSELDCFPCVLYATYLIGFNLVLYQNRVFRFQEKNSNLNFSWNLGVKL